MGVRGLLRHCLENSNDIVRYVNLVQKAEEHNGIEVLVDFHSFENYIVKQVIKCLTMKYNNEFIRILPGEYHIYHEYVTAFISILRSVGITLVFYIDGTRGSCKEVTMYKYETWKQRVIESTKFMGQVEEVCQGSRHILELSDKFIPYVLLEDQLLETLKVAGVEVVACCYGEADSFIAKQLITRPKAYAVLSNDSDFCVMKQCMFIPDVLFDVWDDLHLVNASLFPCQPRRLMVGLITPDKVAASLGLMDHVQLVDWTVLRGNDFTFKYVGDPLKAKTLLDLVRLSNEDIAKWVRFYGCIEGSPVVWNKMSDGMRNAVEFSRNFYNLRLHPGTAASSQNDLLKYLETQVKQSWLPSVVLSMHMGQYWHKDIIQSLRPSIEVLLGGLRGYVYSLVLTPGDKTVNEFGRLFSEQYQAVQISVGDSPFTAPVDGLPSDQSINLDMFHKIMTHLEPDKQTTYFFHQFGYSEGFLCYVVRYTVVIAKSAFPPLHLQQFEIEALVAMVFGQKHLEKDNPLPFYSICPTMRCIDVGNLFQAVYLYAYGRLGKLLKISHLFPSPAQVFSGFTFTAYYMADEQISDNSHITGPMLKALIEERKSCVQKHYTKYQAITHQL